MSEEAVAATTTEEVPQEQAAEQTPATEEVPAPGTEAAGGDQESRKRPHEDDAEGETGEPPAKRAAPDAFISDAPPGTEVAPGTEVPPGTEPAFNGGVSAVSLAPQLHATETRIVSIPNDCVGLIIGKGGEKIRELQENSGAHIQVQKDGEAPVGFPTRNVTMTGSLGAVEIAERLINEVVDEAKRKREEEIAALTGGAPTVTEVIKVPNNMVGLIIGRAGSTINELQQASGARIQVTPNHEVLPGELERNVTLTGTEVSIAKVKELIKEKLDSDQNRGPEFVAIPQTGTPTVIKCGVPDNMVGLLIGKAGATIKELQMNSGARIQIVSADEMPAGSTHRHVTLSGTPQATQSALQLMQQKLAEVSRTEAPGSAQILLFGGSGPGSEWVRQAMQQHAQAAAAAWTAAAPQWGQAWGAQQWGAQQWPQQAWGAQAGQWGQQADWAQQAAYAQQWQQPAAGQQAYTDPNYAQQYAAWGAQAAAAQQQQPAAQQQQAQQQQQWPTQ